MMLYWVDSFKNHSDQFLKYFNGNIKNLIVRFNFYRISWSISKFLFFHHFSSFFLSFTLFLISNFTFFSFLSYSVRHLIKTYPRFTQEDVNGEKLTLLRNQAINEKGFRERISLELELNTENLTKLVGALLNLGRYLKQSKIDFILKIMLIGWNLNFEWESENAKGKHSF